MGAVRSSAECWVRLLVIAVVAAFSFAAVTSGPATADQQQAVEAADAVIAHASEGVLLRAEPTFGAEVLTVLPEGAGVGLRTGQLDTVLDPDGSTRWWPVSTNAGEGWVAGFFLEMGDAAPAPTSAANAAVEAWQESVGGEGGDEWNLVGAAFARVQEPDGVNLRAEPGLGGDAVRVLSHEETITLRIDIADTVYADGSRWWPVGEDGVEGWVSGDFLSPSDWAEPATEEGDDTSWVFSEDPAASVREAVFAANAYVQVRTDDGGGLNMRADGAPDAERIGGLPEGEVVQVMDGFTVDPLGNPWYLVTQNGTTGWVFGDFLVDAGQPDDPARDEPNNASVEQVAERPALPILTIEAYARVATDDRAGLNMRAEPVRDAQRVGVIPDGNVVRVTDGPRDDPAGNTWYRVANDADSGWVRADFLVESTAPVAPAGSATGSFRYPLEAFTLTQGFGCSPYWFEPWSANLGCNYHNALDLAVDAYTPILAADGGTVEQAGWCDCGLGYYVKIDHGNGFKTIYGHMAEMPYVRPGQAVSKGETIGPIGSTGNSTGPHTHFTIQWNGVDVDPLAYL